MLSDNSSNDITLNNFQIPNTNGWQNWQTIEKEFELSEGTYEMTMNVLGNEFNLNWIDFEHIGNLSNFDSSKPTITVFPNPASEIVFVQSVEPIDIVKVFSIKGELMKHVIVNRQNNFYINLNLPRGLYFLKFDNFGVKQIIIEN